MFNHYFMRNPKTGKYVFRRIHDLNKVKLDDILIYRYFFKPHEARIFADFLLTILKWHPADRPTAQAMLEHPWLTMEDKYDYKMSEMEYKLFELKDQAVKLDNYGCDLNYLMENKAILMNPNSNHHLQLDFDQLDALVKSKSKTTGNLLYRYPG